MSGFSHGNCAAVCVLALLSAFEFAPGASIALAATYRTVAMSGEHPPDTEAIAKFSSFGSFIVKSYEPLINEAGQVQFTAHMTCGVCFAVEDGIWSEQSGALRLVAREGSTAPGAGAGVTFASFDVPSGYKQPAFNDMGQTAFYTQIRPSNYGIFSEGGGTLNVLARIGDTAPGAGTAKFTAISPPRLNNVGQVAFRAELSTGGKGVWSQGGGGSLHVVARSGLAAPGAGTGATFSNINDVLINDSGKHAFLGNITGANIGSGDTAIYSDVNGAVQLVAIRGQFAPGVESGTRFASLNLSGFNNHGHTLFSSSLALAGDNFLFPSQRSLWSQAGGSLRLVARSQAAVPGFSAGTTFTGFGRSLLNGADQAAFVGNVQGPGIDFSNDRGIWAEDSGSLRMVVREGMEAPGTGGMKFLRLEDGFAFNDVGRTAFMALVGQGGSSPAYESIWAEGPNGLQLIARENGAITLSNGEVITLGDIGSAFDADDFVGGAHQDGRARSFNNRHELAFRASFVRNGIITHGIFVADASVPEPGSGSLLSIAVGSMLYRRRQRVLR